MKRLLILGILVVLLESTPGLATETARDWVMRAMEHYQAGEYEVSADAYGKSIEAGAKNPTTFYNAACSSALAGRSDEAFARLEKAVELGWNDLNHLESDADLARLHDDERWTALVDLAKEAEREFLAGLEHPELRAELLEMQRVDQAMRRGENIPELEGKTWADVDGAHTERMKEIIAEVGWPNRSKVGKDGAFAAWLLVQHADLQPEFQRECLDLMTAQPEDEVDQINLAYLTDRVLVNEGKEQIYGTQFWTVDGELVPRPIKDPEGLAGRRAAKGMITMEEYTAGMTGRN